VIDGTPRSPDTRTNPPLACFPPALAVAEPLRRTADRRHHHHQPCAGDPGDLGGQPADGIIAGQARRRMVAAEAGGGRLPVCRGVVLEQAMADDLRGVGFRHGRARQSHPPLKPRMSRRRGEASASCYRTENTSRTGPGPQRSSLLAKSGYSRSAPRRHRFGFARGHCSIRSGMICICTRRRRFYLPIAQYGAITAIFGSAVASVGVPSVIGAPNLPRGCQRQGRRAGGNSDLSCSHYGGRLIQWKGGLARQGKRPRLRKPNKGSGEPDHIVRINRFKCHCIRGRRRGPSGGFGVDADVTRGWCDGRSQDYGANRRC
jgi:hypothetical protein